MVGAAGFVIIFVCAFVGCAIATGLFLLFACHYYLVTLIDSTAGHDEVHFPREAIVDWWWKPIFCLWAVVFWILMGSILLSPLLAYSPAAFGVALAVLLWFAYPLSVLSLLHTRNWFFFAHPVIAWRMVRHYWAFAYVNVATLAAAAIGVGLLAGTLLHSFYWGVPAVFVIPAVLLFHARSWGRFAWLSLNFTPRTKKAARSPYMDPPERDRPMNEPPTIEVEEVADHREGIQAGLPAAYPGAPAAPSEVDEWEVDTNPYPIVNAPGQPGFHEKAGDASPVPVPAAQSSVPAAVEEEDEWATDKKPYGLADEPAPAASSTTKAKQAPVPDRDKTVTATQYYDDRAKKEKEAKRKAKEQAEDNSLPTLSRKTPTFQKALLAGVAKFMIDSETLGVWTNLVMLTVVELFFLFMVVKFWPGLD